MGNQWGAGGSSGEQRPNWNQPASMRRKIFGNQRGWCQPPQGNGNASADPEVIVAIGRLNTKLGAPSIAEVYFNTTVYDIGDTLSFTVVFNEKVNVTNGATIALTSTGGTNPLTVTAAEQLNVNQVVFTVTIPNEDGSVVSCGAVSISGTIVDAINTGVNSAKSISAEMGAAAGTVAITAGNSSSSSSSSTVGYATSSSSQNSSSSSSSFSSSSSSVDSSSSSTNSSSSTSSNSSSSTSSNSSSSSVDSSSSSSSNSSSSSVNSSSSSTSSNSSSSSSSVNSSSSSSSSSTEGVQEDFSSSSSTSSSSSST